MPQLEERAALGRVAKLGALYDIRTDSFVDGNIFTSGQENISVDTDDLDETEIELVKTEHLQERYDKLDIDPQLQLSVLSGIVKLDGSAKYLEEEQHHGKDHKKHTSLIYKRKTVTDELAIRKNLEKVDKGILSSSEEQTTGPTHFVAEIDWGAACIITCDHDEGDASEVERELTAEGEILKKFADEETSEKSFQLPTSLDEGNAQSRSKIFNFRTDISDVDHTNPPYTFTEAARRARNLSNRVKDTNDGKGVPVNYRLMSLSELAKKCKIKTKLNIKYAFVDDDIIKRCLDVLTRVTELRQFLLDIQQVVHPNRNFVPHQSITGVDNALEEFVTEESGFIQKLQDMIQRVRSDSDDVPLKAFLDTDQNKGQRQDDESQSFPISKYSQCISTFEKDLDNLTTIHEWRKKGITYLGNTSGQPRVDLKTHAFVLYQTSQYDEDRDRNQRLFLRLQVTHAGDSGYGFYVVDQQLSNHIWPKYIKKTVIHKYSYGRRKSSDLYASEGQASEMCLTEVGPAKSFYIHPRKRAYLQLKCPNRRCGDDSYIWTCSKCKEHIEYGIEEEMFYCKCEMTDPIRARFRCGDSSHDMRFLHFPDRTIYTELSKLQPIRELNILILGETGVGKSTWINGFQNYLYFANLKEAMESQDFHVLIPSSFTFTQQGKETKIEVGGKDGNEVMEAGKSATKEPRSYLFNVDGARIRLIDTPGIGDSEGIDQDKKNVDNILSYLTNFHEIHSVCILLKPNNARLTAMFRFCIQELLVQLHSSAKYNIVFCFTNARGTFYQPGDTLPALNKELEKRDVGIQATPRNYFCFDNEPFRFLACIKNGVEFEEADIETYANSWEKSVDETRRLLKYVNTLKPHNVRDTLSMNEARRIIVAMSKPLAQVAKTIEQNFQEAERAKRQIDIADSDMKSLERNLKFNGYDIKRVELGYPRTVCTHTDCVKFVKIGRGEAENTLYEQKCHKHCYLSGIPTQTTNDPRLRKCACCEGGENCCVCGHHYTMHMHLTYDTTVYGKEFLSPQIQREIQTRGSLKAKKEAFKRQVDTKIRELKEEEKHIMKTGAKYGSFLKANALIPYNDAVGDYLDMCIQQEQMKTTEVRNHALLVTMEEMKAEYYRQVIILDRAIETGQGENIRSPVQVKELQQDLFRLKHFGNTLKNLFDGISITNSCRNKEFGEKVAPTPRRMKDRLKRFRDWIQWY